MKCQYGRCPCCCLVQPVRGLLKNLGVTRGCSRVKCGLVCMWKLAACPCSSVQSLISRSDPTPAHVRKTRRRRCSSRGRGMQVTRRCRAERHGLPGMHAAMGIVVPMVCTESQSLQVYHWSLACADPNRLFVSSTLGLLLQSSQFMLPVLLRARMNFLPQAVAADSVLRQVGR